MRAAPQPAAVVAGAVGHRRHIRLAEHFVRHLAAERLEQLELGGVRLAGRLHRRVLEHRLRAVVGAVHDVLVGPFEIEGVDQRLAQAAVLELRAPRIDEPALRAGRRVVGNTRALDAAVLEGGKIVARRPGARGELLAEQIVAGGEALEADLAVAVIFVAHGVEIVRARAPPADRRPTSPSRARIRWSGRRRRCRLCRRRCRAEYRASIGRTAAWRNRRARRSAGRRRTAARRAPRFGAKRTTTVRSSVASAPVKSRSSCVMIGWPFSFSVVSDQATSCAVSALPSWNFASGRSRKR